MDKSKGQGSLLRPRQKTPHRENTREKVPHIDPLNRGSERILVKNGTRDKYKAGY